MQIKRRVVPLDAVWVGFAGVLNAAVWQLN